MKVLTLLKAKENNNKATTSGAVTVIGGGQNASVDGQTISPAVVNTSLLNVDNIMSNNITNNGTITTAYLNANTVSANTGNFTTLSAQYMNAGDLEVIGDATFQNGLTAYGTSNFEDINSNNITNSGLITTQDLEVLGSAHFFELIIDKIKAAGGSVLLSPADGFKVDDATIENFYVAQYSYSYAPVQEQVPVLWFKSSDGDKTIYNMWEKYDQAICANFNEAKTGTNYDVSNNFWWYMVGATNNDDQNTRFTYSYAGAPVQHNIYENGELKETAECHYIALVPSIGKQGSKDLTNLTNLKDQIGNDVAMLGHNALDNRQLLSVQQRRSAIYMSCYNNWLDTQLKAPLWAHYNKIDGFTLGQAQRLTKFDANGGEIIGSFKVQAGGNITNLDDYILNVAGEKEADIVIQDGNNNNFDTIVLQADENNYIYDLNNFPSMIRIGATYNGNMITSTSDFNSLDINLFGETFDILQGTPTYSQDYEGIYIYNITWSPQTHTYDLIFAFKGNDMLVTSSVITISGNISASGNNYDISGNINVPVITSIEGTDADFYELGVVNEEAKVDADGNMEYNCRYQLRHTVGTTTTYENTNQGFTLRYTVISLSGTTIEQGTAIWTDGTPGYWLKTGTMQNWYTQSVGNKPIRIRVELIDDDNEVVDARIINVFNSPTALFTVKDGLTQSIQAVSNTSYSYFSSLTQTTQGITTTVAAISNNLNQFTSYSYIKFSEIDQRADSISLTVNTLGEGIKQTGINIESGKITLNANNTDINGSLNIYNPDTGITIYNDQNNPVVQIQKSDIPALDEITQSKTFYTGNDLTTKQASSTSITWNTTGTSIGTFQAGDKIKITDLSWFFKTLGNNTPIDNDPYTISFTLVHNGSSVGNVLGTTSCTMDEYDWTSSSATYTYTVPNNGAGSYYLQGHISATDNKSKTSMTYAISCFVMKVVDEITMIGNNGLYTLNDNGNVTYFSDEQYRMQRLTSSPYLHYDGILMHENYATPMRIVGHDDAIGNTPERWYYNSLLGHNDVRYVGVNYYGGGDLQINAFEHYYYDREFDFKYSWVLDKLGHRNGQINSSYNALGTLQQGYGYIYDILPEDEVIVIDNSIFNRSNSLKVNTLYVRLLQKYSSGAAYPYTANISPNIFVGRKIKIINLSSKNLYIVNDYELISYFGEYHDGATTGPWKNIMLPDSTTLDYTYTLSSGETCECLMVSVGGWKIIK